MEGVISCWQGSTICACGCVCSRIDLCSEDVLVRARTDAHFLSRRSGTRYVLRKSHPLNEFRLKGLLSMKDFVLNMAMRVPARLFPKRILRTLCGRILS